MDSEVAKLVDALEDASAGISRAGDYMANHHGLNHRGYEAYLKADEAIGEMLGILRNS